MPEAWVHGSRGLLAAYVLVAAGQCLGQRHAGAGGRAAILWPATALLSTVVVSIAVALLAVPGRALLGFDSRGALAALLGAGLLGGGGYLCGRWWSWWFARPASRRLRGADVRAGSAAVDAAAPGTLSLAGVAVPAVDETKHFKLMGTTGSGKSTVLRELLGGALARGDRAVIADPDGSYLSRFYDPRRGDRILNPFDARSVAWDLFGELRSSYDVDELARSLVPEPGRTADPQWARYARTLFASITSQAQAVGVAEVGELYRLLASAPKAELLDLVDATPAAPFLEEGNEKMFGSIRSTLAEHVRCLDYLRRSTGPALSVRRWVREGTGVLFLPYQADQIATLRSMISTWMRLAIFQTLSLGEGDRRLWFVVDELDALGAIDGLPDALARLRKCGGRCALGFQSIAQVSTTYGDGPAQAMVENCGTSLILRCSASEGGGTARFAARLIGEREVVRVQRAVHAGRGLDRRWLGGSVGWSTHQVIEPAVLSSQIEALPDRAGYLKFASGAAWSAVQFPVRDVARVAEAFVADANP